MTEVNLAVLFAGIVAGATPIVLATLGETLTEKSGLINLSLDGSIMLSAMTAFVVAYETRSVWAGYMAAAGVGATVAMVVALFGLYLGQSQIAVGFVLTLMTRDLAYFLGNSYSRLPGPQVESLSIPLLEKIPFFGEVFFRHNPVVYFSIVLIPFMWWYINRTPMGLKLRAVGEHPEAAYARGIRPSRVKLVYALAGGMLVGMAGATFSLFAKPGWGRPQGAEGTGWIALALVIFGGWDPIKAAIGAYFFAFLQIMGIYFQEWIPSVPAQVFQVAPFPLMIFTLILMHFAQKESVTRWSEKHEWTKPFFRFFSGKAPAALGKRLKSE